MTETTTFTAAGHEWTIVWTAGTSRRLGDLGVTATHPSHLEHLFALRYDRVKLVDAVWACIAGKASGQSISKEQFEESLTAEETEAGFNAMIAAYVNWQPVDLRSLLWEAVAKYYEGVREAAAELVAGFNAEPAVA